MKHDFPALRDHLPAICERWPGWRDCIPLANGFFWYVIDRDAPTALGLNIVVAAYSTWLFNRNKVVDWTILRPLLFSSMPASLAGGLIVLEEHMYKTLTALVLLLASAVMIMQRGRAVDRVGEIPLRESVSIGAVLGLVSGLTGVGGGVFLAPTLIALNWASPRQTVALSPPLSWPIPQSASSELFHRAISLSGFGSIRYLHAGGGGRWSSNRPEMVEPDSHQIHTGGRSARCRHSIGSRLKWKRASFMRAIPARSDRSTRFLRAAAQAWSERLAQH
ncbi:sulfite exporter TauE/SafE family protein [Bradyrhizobium japonicum]